MQSELTSSTPPGPTVAAAAAAGLGADASKAWPQRFRLLLESADKGIYGLDMEGRCTFINRAGAQMLGWRTDQVLGRNMHNLIHHTHGDGSAYPEADCPIFGALRQGLPCRIDSEVLWRADGSSFSAEYSCYPIIDEGVVEGAVATFVDITERQRGEELLRQARDELEPRVQVRTAELSAALEQLRDLSAYSETVREDERTRIARDMHDGLGSLLVALKMDVNWLEKRVEGRPALEDKCQGMGRLIDSAVDKLGRIVAELRPSILDHQGLWAALEWQAQEFVETTALRHEVQVHVSAGVLPPIGVRGERWSIAVFRIFQEMLSNVARHAKAQSVKIRMYVDGPPQAMLHLEVRDDGAGAEREAFAHPNSYGVMGMRERAGHFGGSLMIDSVPGHGTLVRLTMPLPEEETGAPP